MWNHGNLLFFHLFGKISSLDFTWFPPGLALLQVQASMQLGVQYSYIAPVACHMERVREEGLLVG